MSEPRLSQLRWQCRRGMLELDVLLGNFLEKAYPSLSKADQALFVEFLALEDQTLFIWLMGKDSPKDSKFKDLIEKVRLYGKI